MDTDNSDPNSVIFHGELEHLVGLLRDQADGQSPWSRWGIDTDQVVQLRVVHPDRREQAD